MSRKLAALAAVATVAALAFAASATSAAGPGASQQAVPQTTGTTTTTQVGAVKVRLQIKKFVRRAGRLYAVGTAISRFNPSAAKAADLPSATTAQGVHGSRCQDQRILLGQRICPVLDLTLAPLDLELLGLIVDLDRVHLTITANSNGGVLGCLLCGLAGAGRLTPQTIVLTWTRAAQQSGLATKGLNLASRSTRRPRATGEDAEHVSERPLATGDLSPSSTSTLGPLDLNLLGLMVHLDRVHLVITADSERRVLGSLLCSLAGGTASP